MGFSAVMTSSPRPPPKLPPRVAPAGAPAGAPPAGAAGLLPPSEPKLPLVPSSPDRLLRSRAPMSAGVEHRCCWDHC